MAEPQSIVLLGLRCAGKSTIGCRLAEQLDGYAFQDLDQSVLDDCQWANVEELVAVEGWAGFRKREFEQLQIWLWCMHELPERNFVLALGGGTPTHEHSLALLQSAQLHGMIRIVYLRAQPEQLIQRMKPTPDRPSLTGADPVREVRWIFDERDELYKSLADIVVEVGNQTEEETVASINSALAKL